MVHQSRFLYDSDEVVQAVDSGLSEALFQQPKGPVRCKFRVADNEEGDGDRHVKDPPRQVLHHVPKCTCTVILATALLYCGLCIPVLVLSATVISMEVQVFLSKAMRLQV